MIPVNPRQDDANLTAAVSAFTRARKIAALTGAGISVASGIPDFRSPGGLWTIFSPDEYATIDVFMREPGKAWQLYRELGRGLQDKKPNPAHHILADLEQAGLLQGIVTQNIDALHQKAGSQRVFEIHGDHHHLHCIHCGYLEPVIEEHYQTMKIPFCSSCNFPLKPNIVLFGEEVRELESITSFISDCDLLLVIGTSAQVYPAAALPALVRQNGGKVFEFNQEQALGHGITDYYFAGDLGASLPAFGKAVLAG